MRIRLVEKPQVIIQGINVAITLDEDDLQNLREGKAIFAGGMGRPHVTINFEVKEKL